MPAVLDVRSMRLENTRKRGFARTDSERVAESMSFAAPVFDSIGDVTGSLSIATIASRVDADREIELGQRVAVAAAQLSNQLADDSNSTSM